MARNERHLETENQEKRNNVRLDEYRPISVKDLKAGIFHKVTMLNHSKNGMYFESDSILEPGAEIYLGIENSSQVSFADEYEGKRAEIMWRKKLKKSFFNYGYGVQFISADNTKEQKCGNQKEKIDSRKHLRKPYSKSVIFVVDNQILEGKSENISLSGIFIKTKDKFRIGQTIILSLPSKTKKRLKIKGEVVWSNHEGFGVKFLKNLTK
ncbi:MAG: PilZ domain-containing protein [Desulfobacterales bacterium]|jgi:Tfp pilus assembly protein PilZ|nr:PilZ domain-containing protein [Desulfobacterales bacterium]